MCVGEGGGLNMGVGVGVGCVENSWGSHEKKGKKALTVGDWEHSEGREDGVGERLGDGVGGGRGGGGAQHVPGRNTSV